MIVETLVARPDGSQVLEDREVPENWFYAEDTVPEPEPMTPQTLEQTNQRVDELSAANDDIMAALTELAGMVDAMAGGGEVNG